MMSDLDDLAERERRLCEVLAAYFEAIKAGQAPDRADLLDRYPDLADQLVAFLEEQDRLLRATEPLRAIVVAAGCPDTDAGWRPANGDGAALLVARAPARIFGDYELLGEIDRGGMGVVYRARQRSLNRFVALKMLRSGGLTDGDDARRFRLEAEAVAQLDHPNIVPIHEVGEHDGSSYFTMKLIEGSSLARRPPGPAADPRSAARVVATIARAVHHAHQRGVLHRDLKPSNILIDTQGQPHVTDFGLAKRVGGDSELTQSGAILGTPAYMAPEQASGLKGSITRATDIYGLGAVLYALLTGRPPFQSDSVLETIEDVKLREPDPPSGVNRRVDRDLETVCLKCLEKEPGHRYDTAQDLADDLERWLRGESIAARRAGRVEQAWRWCRRNPRATVLLVAMALLALFATVGFAVAWNARDAIAQTNRDQVLRRRLARRKQYVADIQQASDLVESNRVAEALDLLARHRPDRDEEDPRGFEWFYLWRLCHPAGRTLRGHQGDVYHAEFSPDGKLLATSGQDRTVRLWDVATGETRLVLTGHSHDVNYVTFAPDGRTLATASEDQTVKLWDAATGRERQTLSGHQGEVIGVLFTPDGRRLVSCDREEHVIVWDPATGREQSSFRVREGFDEAMAISPDGTTLAVGGGGGVGLWDLATGREKLILDEGSSPVFCVAFGQDGGTLHAASGTTVRIWVIQSGRLRDQYEGRGSLLYSLALTPDGQSIAWADDRGSVEIGSFGHGVRIPTGQDRVWCATFAPDGRTLATASRDGTVKLWDITRDADRQFISVGEEGIWSIAFSPDGRTLSAAGEKGTVWTWEMTGARSLSTQQLSVRGKALCAALSRDATTLAILDSDRSCQVWDLKAGRRLLSIEGIVSPSVQLSHDGAWLFAARGSRQVQARLWAWHTRDGRESIIGDPGWVNTCAVSPDRHNLAWTGDSGGSPRLGDLASGRTRGAHGRGHHRPIHSLEFSADGRMLATSGFDRTIRLWDVETLEERLTLREIKGNAAVLTFAPDGRTLASSNSEDTMRVWDIQAGEISLTLGTFPPMSMARFSPDGSVLATVGLDLGARSQVVLWPAPRVD